ncbi:MAG TPA: glycosyltransferase family 2 protein [Euzebyales bacterium]
MTSANQSELAATTRRDDPGAVVDDPAVRVPPKMRPALYSVVIPVFNSADIVGETIDRTVAFFREHGLTFEIVCVNDGSRDDSWQVLEAKAAQNREVVPINLLRNYGQHNANLCGFRHARGDWIVTIDDDLQNPPEEILNLLVAADAGDHDVVFGRFDRKQAAGHRRLGSLVIGMINRRVFGQPRDLVVSNFRLLRRDVVDRICADRSAFPYITGLALLYSRNRGNTGVRHAPRATGHSNYNFLRITRLVLTILFSYSAFPLRLSAVLGAIVALVAFATGAVYLVAGLMGATRVQGWTSLIVLLSFFNGVTILMLSMLGEYIVRTLNQTSSREPYHVLEIIRHESGDEGAAPPDAV